MLSSEFPTIDLMGVSIHAAEENACIDYIIQRAMHRHGGWVVTANLDHLRRLVGQPSYRELCSEATLLVPDGMPLLWASRIRGTPLPERVAGSNLIVSLSRAAARAHISVFLLGGNPGTADGAAEVLASRCPGLQVLGTSCPMHGFESDTEQLRELERTLQEHGPGIVYVALGSPKQELVIRHLRQSLPSVWWIGVGISFSYLTGDVHRAPHWLQAIGLEWLHRLSREPRRLFRRYVVDGVPFALRLFWDSARRRLASPVGASAGDHRSGTLPLPMAGGSESCSVLSPPTGTTHATSMENSR